MVFVVEFKGGSCLTFQLIESLIGLLNPPKSDKKMHWDSSPIWCLFSHKTGCSNLLWRKLFNWDWLVALQTWMNSTFIFHVSCYTALPERWTPSHHHSMYTKHPTKTDWEPVCLVFYIVTITMTLQTFVANEIFICLKRKFSISKFKPFLFLIQ